MKKVEAYQFNLEGTVEQQEHAKATGEMPIIVAEFVMPRDAIVRRVNARILQRQVMGIHPQTKEMGRYAVNEESAWLWAEIDTSQPLETHKFYIVPTGVDIPTEADTYVGTFLLQAGGIVLHVYR